MKKKLTSFKHGVLAAALVTGLAACADEGPIENEGVVGTGGIAGPVETYDYDNDVDTFLTDYVREDEMFADDQLEYEVREGLVTVTGALDSVAERDALVNRIRRVPGVRDVNITGLTVGEAGL